MGEFSQKKINSILLLFLLFIPAFAQSSPTGIEVNDAKESTPSKAKIIYEEIRNNALETNNPISKGLTLTFARPMSVISAFFSTINEVLDFILTLIIFIILIVAFLTVQAFFIALWRIIIKTSIKIYLAIKIITAPTSDINTLIEAIGNKKAEYSKTTANKLKQGGSLTFMAKLKTVLDLM